MIGSWIAPRRLMTMLAAGEQVMGIKYLRASQDSSGRQISVSSQRDEGNDFFDETGLTCVAEFSDNDLSASTYATEVREDYERALETLRTGAAQLMWTFESARAQRDLEIYVRLRRICKETGSFWAYGGRIYDMQDPADRKATNRDAVEAEGASDILSGHVKRGKRKRARDGKHAGPIPYGYSRQFDPKTGESLGQVIDPAQEEIVRKIVDWCLERKALSWIARQLNSDGVPCARDRRWDVRLVRRLVTESQHQAEWQRLLDRLSPEDADLVQALVARIAEGETPRSVAQELNREGVLYVEPSLWDETKVRNIALSKPAAGIRIENGTVVMVKVTGDDGTVTMEPVKAQWKAIVEPDEHILLTAMLNDPSRKLNKDGMRVRHFWSGIARCGVCDMGVSVRNPPDLGPIYRCPSGHVLRNRVLLDTWLIDQAMTQLERADAAELFRVGAKVGHAATAAEQVKVLRAELAGWRHDAAAGRVSRESFCEIEPGLLDRIAKAQTKSERMGLPPSLAKVIGPNAREAFAALEVKEQREILRAIMRPRIYRSPHNKVRLDTSTIDPGFLFHEPEPATVNEAEASDAVAA